MRRSPGRYGPWRWGAARVIAAAAAALALLGLAAAFALARATRSVHDGRPAAMLAGATLAPIGDPALLVVTSLRSGGPAAVAGLRVGDAILAVDGRDRPGAAVLWQERSVRADRPLDLRLRRGRDVVAVPLLSGAGGDDDGPAHPSGRGR